MTRRVWFVLLSVLALVPIAIGVAGAGPGPVRLEQATVIVEVNETDGDAGLQIFLDGDAWRQVAAFRPDGQKIAEFATAGPVNDYGLTELFSESSEPPFTEFPLSQFKSLFPEGEYAFSGTTIDGQAVVGSATLTHDIPNGPNLVAPEDGERVDASDVVIRWREGSQPAGVQIDAYQVVVTRERPLRVLEVDLRGTVHRLTVPSEFLERGGRYKYEVLAIDTGGNQTLTERSFVVR
jgi:hypothetical protein